MIRKTTKSSEKKTVRRSYNTKNSKPNVFGLLNIVFTILLLSSAALGTVLLVFFEKVQYQGWFDVLSERVFSLTLLFVVFWAAYFVFRKLFVYLEK